MRRHYLTLSVLAALLITACAAEPVTDAEVVISPDPVASAAAPAPQAPLAADKAPKPSSKTPAKKTTNADLAKRYQDLDPFEISRAEIDDLLAMEAKVNEGQKDYRRAMRAWRKQDRAQRGGAPARPPSALSPEEAARLKLLKGKLQNAEIRKRYENSDLNALTPAEVQEIILLEQDQTRLLAAYQKDITAWRNQDPATRGPEPSRMSIWGGNPRLLELQAKIESANNIERLNARVEKLSDSYNISLSDSELSELTALETESQKFQMEFAKAMMEAEKNSRASGIEMDEEAILETFPKHLVQRMMDVDQRMNVIKAPLEAAEKADKIQKRMAKLSEDSGVPILSGEIAETIALNAEKDRINDKVEQAAIQKWISEDGPIPTGQPLPNDEDYARLKEIEARLTAISAPMTAAKQAAAEADNPALRTQRLQRETRKKWQSDWRDKQQAGEIPADTPLTSPSYAELQARTTDYSAKLKSRAEKAGYAVPDADIKRLDALNADMLAIRKSVYDMEAGGTSRVKGKYGYRAAASGLTSGMYKIQLIEQKQREILAGLSEAEKLQSGATSETGTRQFNQHEFANFEDKRGADAVIESYRKRGLEISEADADDLRAFEQELQGR